MTTTLDGVTHAMTVWMWGWGTRCGMRARATRRDMVDKEVDCMACIATENNTDARLQ